MAKAPARADTAIFFITAGAFGPNAGIAYRDRLAIYREDLASAHLRKSALQHTNQRPFAPLRVTRYACHSERSEESRYRSFMQLGTSKGYIGSYFIDYDNDAINVMRDANFEIFVLPSATLTVLDRAVRKLSTHELTDPIKADIARQMRMGEVAENPRFVRLLLEDCEADLKLMFEGKVDTLQAQGIQRFYFVIAFAPSAPTGSTVAQFLGKNLPIWFQEWGGSIVSEENQMKFRAGKFGKFLVFRSVALQVVPQEP